MKKKAELSRKEKKLTSLSLTSSPPRHHGPFLRFFKKGELLFQRAYLLNSLFPPRDTSSFSSVRSSLHLAGWLVEEVSPLLASSFFY